MALPILWFIVISFFWTGFFILEGFDLGVGSLHMLVGTTDIERRVAINSIGPFWDGNEVWLIVAGAGMFAAFPAWYATMFSSLYLAMMLLLLALIIRGGVFRVPREGPSSLVAGYVGLDPDHRERPSPTPRRDRTRGPGARLPIDEAGELHGFLDLLTPYGIWVGVTLLALTLAHGAMYLSLKTTGNVQHRSQRLAEPFAWVVALAVIGFVIWTHVQSGRGVLLSPIQIAAILFAIVAAWSVRDGHPGWGFTATTGTLATAVVSIFVTLYPNVMVSSTSSAFNLTVANSAASHYALTTMTVVAVVFTPLVLAYQAWSYHVFRARVVGPGEKKEPVAPATEGSGTP